MKLMFIQKKEYKKYPASRYEIFIIKLEIYYARNSRAKPAISFFCLPFLLFSARERRVVIYFFLKPL